MSFFIFAGLVADIFDKTEGLATEVSFFVVYAKKFVVLVL